MPVDFVVIGGGIIGLATAFQLRREMPGAAIQVLEKASCPAAHQTGRNSGVIHSGVYYAPGSLKASFCKAGNQSMKAFCAEYDVPFEECGKLIVACSSEEIGRLQALRDRANGHGLKFAWLEGAAIQEVEPHCAGLAALHFPSTSIVDYRAVCEKLVELLRAESVDVRFDAEVRSISDNANGALVNVAGAEPIVARMAINCCGLHSDRIARASGVTRSGRIVPFKGEFFTLKPSAESLVKGLIYPVPNPKLPFVGVHLTRMMRGGVHVGPNALLCLSREGYARFAFSARDAWDVISYPGAWRLGSKYAVFGAGEVVRSLSKSLFARDVQRLVPDVRVDDLLPCDPGIRAQLVTPDGRLFEDFLIERGPRSIHVLNAPSPAATASLEIGRHVARQSIKNLNLH